MTPPSTARWFRSLRTRLIGPIILLMAIAATAIVLLQNALSARTQDQYWSHRGRGTLEIVMSKLEAKADSQAVFANLLANYTGAADALAIGDLPGAAAALEPMQRTLGIPHVSVYGADGSMLISLGAPLSTALGAEAGLPKEPEVITTPEGLMILASAEVNGPSGPLGTVVTAAPISAANLSALRPVTGVELMVLHKGDLAASTWTGAPNLNGYQVVKKPLGEDGVLIALFPSSHIDSQVHVVTLLMVALALLAALLILALWYVRTVARPLHGMVQAARSVTAGNYSVRASGGGIPELEALAASLNHLSEHTQQEVEDLSHRAFFDRLTGLPNRVLFMERLEHALTRTRRNESLIGLMFLDLDTFKQINDTLGHQTGDLLLEAIGERLAASVRPHDTVGRLSGDEFVVLLEDLHEPSAVLAIADRILHALKAPVQVDHSQLWVTASIGVVIDRGLTSTPEQLLRQADLAMYRAKEMGGDRYELFDQELQMHMQRRAALESDLRRVIEGNELLLHYQPAVSLETNRIVQVEALLRWNHPDRGVVRPGDFLPLAEDIGMIGVIDQWVLSQACAQGKRWLDRFPDTPVTISVNLSVRQLQQRNLVDVVQDALRQSGLPPELLSLEISEEVLLRNEELVENTLERLKEMGVKLSVDNFGRRFSPLRYLKRLPTDLVQIDRSLVTGAGDDPIDTEIIQSTIQLARAMGKRTAATGVETEEQCLWMRTLGCDLGQGFYFSRPVPPDVVDRWLASGADIRTLQAS